MDLTRRRAVRAALPPLAYTALAILVFLPAWLHPTTRAVGQSGDPQQSIWFLSWTPWAIGHGVNPFFTTHINFPDGVNLMWNSWAPLLGFVLWPITATGGPVLAYNVLQTAAIAGSAWLAFVAARRYLPGAAAAVTGLLYGFGPFLMLQAHGHAKVSFGWLPPLLLILGDEILVRRRRSARTLGILLGLAVAAQALILEESVVIAALFGAAGVAVLAVMFRSQVRDRWRRAAVALAWSVAVFAVIAAGPLAIQLLGAGRVHGNVTGAAIYIADPVSVVVPSSLQWLSFGSLSAQVDGYAGNVVESSAYIGVPLLLIVAITVVAWRRRPLVRWAAITALLVGILALGPTLQVAGHDTPIPLPFGLVQRVSHLGSALPAHFFVFVDLLVALLAGVFVAELARVARRRDTRRVPLRVAGGTVLALLAGLTLVPQVPFATTAMAVPDFFTTAQLDDTVRSGSVALLAPWTQDGSLDDAMVWQATSGMHFKMPEGYFIRPNERAEPRRDGPTPTPTSRAMVAIATTGRAPRLPAALRRDVMRDLKRWKVATVVVGPMAHAAEMERFFTAVLGRPAGHRGGVLVWKVG